MFKAAERRNVRRAVVRRWIAQERVRRRRWGEGSGSRWASVSGPQGEAMTGRRQADELPLIGRLSRCRRLKVVLGLSSRLATYTEPVTDARLQVEQATREQLTRLLLRQLRDLGLPLDIEAGVAASRREWAQKRCSEIIL
jgi:hypothetical protein